MTALLTIRLAGSVVRSCGARCHEAISAVDECDCLCEGANHGAGLDQAITNTRQMSADWLERARARGLDFDEHELSEAVTQEPLFTIGDL